MATKRGVKPNETVRGYQPIVPQVLEGGYQPQAALPPKLTPPKSGTGIQPPQASRGKPSEPKK